MSPKPQPDDSPEPVEGQVYEPGERTPAETSKLATQYPMPVLPEPPSEEGGALFKTTLTTAITNWSKARIATGYEKAFQAYEKAVRAAAAVGEAIIHHQRTAAELEDLDKILDADRRERDTEHMEAEMRHWDVQMRYRTKEQEYQRFMEGKPSDEDDIDNLSEEEEEFDDELVRTTSPKRFNAIVERRVGKFIRERGGADKLTPEDKEFISELRRRGEQMIKDHDL